MGEPDQFYSENTKSSDTEIVPGIMIPGTISKSSDTEIVPGIM